MRKKAQVQAADESVSQDQDSSSPISKCSRTWAMLIKRIYEVDPLACPKCGGVMKVVAFIEPPQAQVIERILRHCGLWQEPVSRAPPDTDGLVRDLDFGFSDRKARCPGPDQAQNLIYEDIYTFLATF